MTPASELEALRITPSELDQLTGLDIGSVFMGGIIRPSVFRSWRQLTSLIITECLVLGVVFIVCLGLGLVLVRQREGFHQLSSLLFGIAGAIGLGTILWHLYQWRRSKQLITLAHLLEEVDRHNDIIQALQVMDELEAVQVTSPGIPNRTEVIIALQTTRNSLISALMTEKILRRHQALIKRRHELFHTIETNLATLQTLQVEHQASEYRQFLQEALEIGIAVRQQIEAQESGAIGTSRHQTGNH